MKNMLSYLCLKSQDLSKKKTEKQIQIISRDVPKKVSNHTEHIQND